MSCASPFRLTPTADLDLTRSSSKGDGTTDDTDAINQAISSGNRCGEGCDSSTITPALVYFPPGTYRISAPIISYYYTQLVGDKKRRPVLKPTPNFQGIAVIDADPYLPGGANWYTNQNNFFREGELEIGFLCWKCANGTDKLLAIASSASRSSSKLHHRSDGPAH